ACLERHLGTDHLRSHLRRGQLLLILDGLDELVGALPAQDGAAVWDAVRDLAGSCAPPRNASERRARILVSCRTSVFERDLLRRPLEPAIPGHEGRAFYITGLSPAEVLRSAAEELRDQAVEDPTVRARLMEICRCTLVLVA